MGLVNASRILDIRDVDVSPYNICWGEHACWFTYSRFLSSETSHRSCYWKFLIYLFIYFIYFCDL